MTKVLGVDGCRSGWVAVQSNSSNSQLSGAVYARFSDLLAAHADADRIWVDIPIGLPWAQCRKRKCDSEARHLLASRASSIFSPPSRPAAYASDYAQARQKNLAELGCSLSIQAWGICSKIVEVDDLFARRKALPTMVVEAYPELCFWHLNGKVPLSANKKTAEGRAQRAKLLIAHNPNVDAELQRLISQTRRKDVQVDDLLDAMALAIRARQSLTHPAIPLADGEQTDAIGLSMQIYY